jgi:hypothetical protein
MHDLLLGPWRLMRVVVRDPEELMLVCNTSQCEAVKIAFRIDQPFECGLVLGFWDGRFVEVNVGMEESGPFGEIRLPEGCDACFCGGLHCALLMLMLMLSEDKWANYQVRPTSHSHPMPDLHQNKPSVRYVGPV